MTCDSKINLHMNGDKYSWNVNVNVVLWYDTQNRRKYAYHE